MNKLITIVMAGLLAACGGNAGKPLVNSPAEGMPASSQASSLQRYQTFNLVPWPAYVVDKADELGQGFLSFSSQLALSVDAAALNSAASIASLLNDLNIGIDDAAEVKLTLTLGSFPDLGDEGYKLLVDKNISLSAQTDAGLFYGIQTLKQLLPTSGQPFYLLPAVEIIDVPEYAWRGSMIDVARNFFSLDYLKKHIKRMAAFKLNKLHLHLSDDQGWRMEIKKYPRLTSVGGSTGAGGGSGGFYTQDELKDLVAFAAQHHIEIIPELDMPGHVQAAIASYNELACDNVTNLSLYTGLEVGFSSLCLSKPDVIYPFVQEVLSEVAEVFPSSYIHLGGDEIKHALYPDFIDRASDIIHGLNKTMIGWEEASAGKNLRSDTLLQLWNDNYDIRSATNRNIHLILSPCSYFYLDHGNYAGQPNTYSWCRKAGVPLERIYSFNPQQYSLVHGIEAATWSEVIKTEAELDNRIWPRLAAVAEIAWSKQSDRDYQQFILRLSELKPYFDREGIAYYAHPDLGW
jgi:hexosaminidase